MTIKLHDIQLLETESDYAEAITRLADDCSRFLRIRSAFLDPEILDTAACADALSAFSRRSRFCHVQILVDFPREILTRGHRLLELSRRLNDKIEIREFYDEQDSERDTEIICDYHAALIKPYQADSQGMVSYTDKVTAAEMAERFEHDWQRSQPARVLRQLSL